jgi:hypothetical protein
MKALNLSIIASIIQGFHYEIKVSKEVSRITIEEEDANHEERKESECVDKKQEEGSQPQDCVFQLQIV